MSPFVSYTGLLLVDLVTRVSMFLPFFKYYVWNVICVCVCVCVLCSCVLSYFVMGEVCYERSKHDKESLIDNCIVLVYSCCLVSLTFLCLSVATTTDLESGHSQQILHQPSNIDIVSWRHIERIRMLLCVKTSHMVVMEQNGYSPGNLLYETKKKMGCLNKPYKPINRYAVVSLVWHPCDI